MSDLEEDDIVLNSENEDDTDEDIPVLPPFPHVLQPTNSEINELTSRDGTMIWKKHPVHMGVGQPIAANILTQRQGPTKSTLRTCGNSVRDAFQVFITPEIVRKIVEHTNTEGRRILGLNWNTVTQQEMDAFFGLLLLAGVYHSHNASIDELWHKSDGRPIFSQSMSRNRFKEIRRFIRFDDKSDREERRKNDKFAPLRDIFTLVVSKFKSAYHAGENVTVDEQLVTFRGRCAFKVYIPSKPGRYGVKQWALTDSSNSYCSNLQPYIGKVGNLAEKKQGERVVLELTDHLTGTGRHITGDNFFSSIDLVRSLLGRRLTYSGTLRKNKPQIPTELQPSRKRATNSSIFAFQKDITLVSYVPKTNKAVVLVSSFHHSADISHEEHRKPKIILDYNKCKGGVDTLDQLVRHYTCKRKTSRWPLAVFSNLLDIAGYNALILFTWVHPNYMGGAKNRRRKFLVELAKSLLPQQPAVTPIIQNLALTPAVEKPTRQGRCALCPRNADKKTKDQCSKCHRLICKEHQTKFCVSCSPAAL
jgi:hypothetical protein